ncbi:unnamed protein product [Caenorhabditis bovis]|uniref:Major sperm protein n=1 Tax=Caenorhabditis bovis TaxID=2654633 RepID=A0A8S1EF49_9PELO|nr:unnamed protein product [Caenorhabditis bovis]
MTLLNKSASLETSEGVLKIEIPSGPGAKLFQNCILDFRSEDWRLYRARCCAKAKADLEGADASLYNEEILSDHKERMAQSVPPGDIQTQPNAKIVFNAPYDDKHTYHIKVINSSARRIGYGIKTTNMKRLGVDPPCGVLDPKEAVLLAVSCDAFAYGQEDTNNDRITVEWTNTPDGAAKQFRREWFQGDGMVRRKNLPIEYNP